MSNYLCLIITWKCVKIVAFVCRGSYSPKFSTYPNSAFKSPLSPLLACVSLGPHNGIIVFNDLVIGGALFYFLGGFVKFVIERSKVPPRIITATNHCIYSQVSVCIWSQHSRTWYSRSHNNIFISYQYLQAYILYSCCIQISEIRNEFWGRAFWALGHIITNVIHRWMTRLHLFVSFAFDSCRSLMSERKKIFKVA